MADVQNDRQRPGFKSTTALAILLRELLQQLNEACEESRALRRAVSDLQAEIGRCDR